MMNWEESTMKMLNQSNTYLGSAASDEESWWRCSYAPVYIMIWAQAITTQSRDWLVIGKKLRLLGEGRTFYLRSWIYNVPCNKIMPSMYTVTARMPFVHSIPLTDIKINKYTQYINVLWEKFYIHGSIKFKCKYSLHQPTIQSTQGGNWMCLELPAIDGVEQF